MSLLNQIRTQQEAFRASVRANGKVKVHPKQVSGTALRDFQPVNPLAEWYVLLEGEIQEARELQAWGEIQIVRIANDYYARPAQ